MSNPNSGQGAADGKSPDSHRAIIKSTSVMSLGTLSSRVLGFLRDMILAHLLGTGFKADAFFVAQKIPNLFRDLVGEGAINAAVVPVLAEYKQSHKPENFWNFVSVVLALALIALSFITILGVIFAPVLIRVIVPGFMAEPEKLQLTIQLTRLMFPYLVFIGLTAYAMGILYTFRSFAVPAFSPCLLNIAVIASAVIASRTMEEPVFGLALGVLAGGLLQLFVHIRPLKATGLKFCWPRSLSHEGAVKIGRLLVPRLIGSGIYQLTVLLDNFCASLTAIVGTGGIAVIYYSNRIIQFPMGIFTVALASAMLPSLSGLAHKKDMPSVKKMIIFSLENIFFIMCPTTAILLLLAGPIIRVLFERGAFDAHSTAITSGTLAFYAVGMFSFSGIKILVTAFHSLQDTRTPVIVAGACLLLNATLNFILMVPLKVGGIALATSIAATVDFLILFYILNRRFNGFGGGLLAYFGKVVVVSLIVAGWEYWAWTKAAFGPEWVKLILVGSSGFALYFMLCLLVKVEQAVNIWKWISRRT